MSDWAVRPTVSWRHRPADGSLPAAITVASGGTVDVAARSLTRVANPVTFDEPVDVPVTLSALPRPVHLVTYRGDDFVLTLVVRDAEGEPADLTGFEVAAQVRVEPDGQYMGEFDTSIDDNVIGLRLHHDTSAVLPRQAAWDCQLVLDGEWVTTIVAGTISLTPDVTRR